MQLDPLLAPFRGQGRTALLPALHKIQEAYGWISPDAARAVARALSVPLADVYGVITFYAMFYDRPAGRTIIRVCRGPICALRGAPTLQKQLTAHLGVEEGEPTQDQAWMVESVPCLGLCDHAPAVLVGDQAFGPVTQLQHPEAVLERQLPHPRPRVDGPARRLTAHLGDAPLDLETYRANGGYEALAGALRQMTPKDVREAVKAAGLWGRGGAAFPTGLKWEFAAQAPGEPKYVVCNADESEPGTFKDRVLMEGNPHLVLEGLILAGYAVGARKGYIYVRGEYAQAYRALEQAIEEAREAGFLGDRILGTDFTFDVELRRGAGAYICGEETALFESIEGKRGYPRLKPPYPTTHGLFGKPTAINNVETLANVPFIVREGPAAYRTLGTEDSPGTKLFSISGDVARPGVYEAPFGITLRELLETWAGGVTGELGAVLVGGAAGAFVPPEDIDWPLTLEEGRKRSVPIGTGTVMVFNRTRDLRTVLLNLAEFFAEESCGKCFPCQLGTQRQWEILQRLIRGEGRPADLALLQDIGHTMAEASICGLGQTASMALLSALRLWPDLFQNHGS